MSSAVLVYGTSTSTALFFLLLAALCLSSNITLAHLHVILYLILKLGNMRALPSVQGVTAEGQGTSTVALFRHEKVVLNVFMFFLL